MSVLISTAISELQRETQTAGVRIDDNDFILALKRANQYFMSSYKMPTAEREHHFLVFPSVYEYAAPSDFLGWFEPKRPYGINSPQFVHTTENEMTHYLKDRKTAFKFDRETQFLVVKDDADGSSSLIHNLDDVDENGTWSVSGDGSGLVEDKQIFTEGSASLRFTVTGSGGTTTIVNSTFTAQDLTDYEDKAYFFLELICPSANTSALTSIRLRIGSSASAYWQMTPTTRHRGDSINAGAGLIGFDWSTATEVGSPSVTAINYAQFVITHPTSGINGVYRIDNFFVALPTYYQLPYYSTGNVKTTGGAYQQHPTATTDTILCPSDFDNSLVYKALELCAVHQLQNQSLAAYAARELIRFEIGLRAKYPSQERRAQMTWYKKADT